MKYHIVYTCPELRCSKISNRAHSGISYLRSYLEYKGFKTAYARHRTVFSINEYIDFLKSFNTIIYGFSATDDTLDLVIKCIDELKKQRNCICIIGGAVSKPETAEYILGKSLCDAFIVGEGEIPTEKFLKYYYKNYELPIQSIDGVAVWDKKSDQLIYKENTFQIDINSYPSPIINGYVDELDLADNGIFSSRGCFHRCLYCSFGTNSSWKTRFYDEDRFLEEISVILKAVYKNKQDVEIPIWDDAFTLVPSRAKRLLKEIIKINKYNAKFWLQTRIDCLDEEIIALMKKAGVDHVGIGLESASPKILKNIRKVRLKDFEEDGTEVEEDFINKFEHFSSVFRKYDLQYTINIIMGLPGEEKEDALNSIRFVQKLKPKYYFHSYLRLYTGTPLAHNYEKYGYKITCRNTHNTLYKYPVNAKIVDYPFDVYEIPKLPYRLREKETMIIDGNLFIDNEFVNTVVADDSSQNFNHMFFKNKELMIMKKAYSENGLYEKTQYLSSSAFLSLKSRLCFESIEVELSDWKHFYRKLSKEFNTSTYERYTKYADTTLLFNISNKKSMDYLLILSNTFNYGGRIELPDNIINIQFKDISLKNICRYGNVCSALLQRRTFYTDNKILTCESGKEVVNLNDYDKYENSFSNLMDTTMQKRKCNNCIANKKCSKCSSIKDEYLESYCRIQKNQYSILEIIMFMNYVIKQIIDPLDLVEYSMIQNEIIFPRQEKLEVKAIISLNEKKYFVRKSDRGYSLLKIGDSMYECIKMYWECNDYAKVNIFLKVKYNLADDKRKKILEYMRLNF